MNINANKRRSIAFGLLATLTACGGHSGSSSTDASSIGGTVAVGNLLAGATVTLFDSAGKSAGATSDSSGNYSIALSGMTAPFLLVATDPGGANAPMYSVTASAKTSSGAALIANVTPLTTAVAAELTSDGNPLDLTKPATLAAKVTTSSVGNAVSTLNGILTPVLSANGLAASTFNPVSQSFTPNQTGADAVIDSVALTQAPSGGLQIASIAAPTSTIALNSSTSASTQIIASPVAANYLATLLTQLSQCLSGTSSACSSAIDASYLENGYNSSNGGFQTWHARLSASGSTITGAKTLSYWAAGQSPFPNITAASALVNIFFTNSAGQHQFATTVVQSTGSGNWDIIGNQQAYDVSIGSFVTQRQFLDADDASGSRFETGLGISIPVHSASTVNPANIGSVQVTGAGLPSTGVWLEPRSGTGNTALALTSHALTSAPTSAATSSSNTSLYRWAWQALSSDSSTFAFAPTTSDEGFYAATALTAQTLPSAYSTYTATLYDTTGAQIGNPVKVVNATTPLLPDAAQSVTWQTLGSDVTSNFMSPSGSLAAAQTTATIDWAGVVNGANLSPLVTGVQIQAGSDTSSSTPAEVDGWWTGLASAQNSQFSESVTAGVAQNGTQTCSTACTFPALVAGVSRLVQLNWSTDGVTYYNIWKYYD
ncbi:hypothetical protein [Paraburkholderia sp. J67]|uniref:hypothetical protein n=1 Tax=Paraburkholderia sp. J67 TaxID=2805435 RepID=UPI002ABE115D|nr:hypothetical protein [Paraburkholderia sp. J67]